MSEAREYWCVVVRPTRPEFDARGRDVVGDIHRLGIDHVRAVRASRLYLLHGALTRGAVERLASTLLADPVTEAWHASPGLTHRAWSLPTIEVHLQAGVMDPPALSIRDAAARLLGREGAALVEVRTARAYELDAVCGPAELERIASRLLANGCIERWYIFCDSRRDELPAAFPSPVRREFTLRRVPLAPLDDAALQQLSRQAHLFLAPAEMSAIRDHFVAQGREPTDIELETLAQTWSEHCVHKTLKSEIVYRGDDFGREGTVEVRFENLLRETIVATTRQLNLPWCLSVFVDNAGVVAFDDDFGVAFKVETHNHPSAIEPYGGAATGIGGCIRDIIGCGLGAKPIASTDVFCLAPPDFPAERLPRDVLHPRRTLRGVVGGVRDYGNRMGIPTVNGAIHFDERYLANPLVFCGCVGLIPRNRLAKRPQVGDRIVVAGGRTGRDGIHGATFSSAELTDTHADEFAHAVQIGNAIEQKKLLDALLHARDHHSGCLYTAVTDCGAGGLSSAVGEMGAELGAVVDLERVPLKYEGLRYDEIWISEAQERMVFAVPPASLDEFLRVCADEEVEATVIGEFTGDHRLVVRFRGTVVADLSMDFLHDGRPRSPRTATWSRSKQQAARTASRATEPSERPLDVANLLAALAHPTVASKEWVVRQYDHEVQSRSVVKPLVGPNAGPSDAAVLRPRLDSQRAIAIGCGLNLEAGNADPYWMAVLGVDEALRNVICVGGDPNHTSILDNFCWPKVDNEESLGALVRACRGAADAATAFRLPFISGKDSLNNEFSMSEGEAARTGLPRQLPIPYTLLISALSIVADARRCITMDLKRPGNVLALASAPVERMGFAAATSMHHAVATAIAGGRIASAHDVSDGGVACAIAEMIIASGLGVEIAERTACLDERPFEHVGTTYVLEMSERDASAVGWPIIGRVTREPALRIGDRLNLAAAELSAAWRSPLDAGGGIGDG